MPRRTKRRARKRPRKLKRKRHVPLLLGNSQIVKMREVQGFKLDPAAGAMLSNVFVANGVTNTSITLANSKPIGFDQMNAFFGQYKVLSSKCTVQYVPTATPGVTPAVIGVFLDNDATLGYTSYQDIMENQQSNFGKRVNLAGISANRRFKSSASYNLKTELRTNNSSMATLLGDAAANPLESRFYQVYCASPDIASNPGIIHMVVTLEYVVQWFNKELVPASTPI